MSIPVFQEQLVVEQRLVVRERIIVRKHTVYVSTSSRPTCGASDSRSHSEGDVVLGGGDGTAPGTAAR